MPPTTLPPITLIVATTPVPSPNAPARLGIGLNGTLPWPRIKTDMSFFARVTARLPLPGSASTSSTTGTATATGKTRTNAVIMGRKTYDSIPLKLRPLGKRVNVVISRDDDGGVTRRVSEELEGKVGRERDLAAAKAKANAGVEVQQTTASAPAPALTSAVPEGQTDAFVSSSLESALKTLDESVSKDEVGHIYIIGGAEIYASSLKIDDGRKVRIVMTDVEKVDGGAFECDTYFPLDGGVLGGDEGEGWRKVGAEEVSGWVGEEVGGEWVVEGDVRVRMVGYERG
ncbi:dihydrofolate reductase-like domain-containing protein [Aspergillus karnatakaensis]|uniref:dihydrofolate reductase n=1 Tax=Aspergillus karnatakaensis TaxID=1810916 RepID=UPI003CCD3FD6